MEEFKVGDYIEVGFGESIYDEDGYSLYFKMDVEGYSEYEVYNTLYGMDNILYINVVDDESAVHFARGAKFSDYLKKWSLKDSSRTRLF